MILLVSIIAALLVGALVGLGPLTYGKRKGHPKLARAGFAWCLLGGLYGGIILALVIGATYMIFLYNKGKKSRAPENPEVLIPELIHWENEASTWDKMKRIRLWEVILVMVLTQVFVAVFGLLSPKHLIFLWNSIAYILAALWLNVRCEKLRVSLYELMPSIPKPFNWFNFGGGLSLLLIFSLAFHIYYVLPQPVLIPLSAIAQSYNLNSLCIFILVPIVEEILFRGVLLHHLAERWNSNRSIVVSSLIFMAMHWKFSIPIFILGVIANCLFLKTGTLRIPIIFHALYNFFIVTLVTLYEGGHINAMVMKSASPWIMVISGMGLIGYIYSYWPRNKAFPWIGEEKKFDSPQAQSMQNANIEG